MKTLIKLVTLSVAAVLAYKAYENNKKNKEVKEFIEVDLPKRELPTLNIVSKLEGTLVQSFRVQSQVMMDSYPYNSHIDIIHTVSFVEFDQLSKYTEILKKQNTNYEYNMDDLSINLRNTIKTDAQDAFNEIIKVAESTLDYQGIYHGWVFENLK